MAPRPEIGAGRGGLDQDGRKPPIGLGAAPDRRGERKGGNLGHDRSARPNGSVWGDAAAARRAFCQRASTRAAPLVVSTACVTLPTAAEIAPMFWAIAPIAPEASCMPADISCVTALCCSTAVAVRTT